MANFLRENKTSQVPLILHSNQILGRVGFSLTREVLQSLIASISSYLLENAYDAINLATDGSYWATTLLEEAILPDIEGFGVRVNRVVEAVPVGQFLWFSTQTKKKTLSFYIGRDSQLDEYITIYLFDEKSSPVTEKKIQEILKYPNKIKTEESDSFQVRPIDNLNLDLYLKYLYDTGLLSRLDKPSVIHLDAMFGAFETTAQLLRKIPDLTLKVYNTPKEPPRLVNYLPKPTGKNLQWYTTYKEVSNSHFFFGVDGDGDSLGVYDLKQTVEIGPSGVALLLIKYLTEFKKVSNLHVLYSPACGSKIKDFCKKNSIKCTEVHDYFNSVAEARTKDSYTFYADEQGRYYFNEEYVWSNLVLAMLYLVSLCNVTNKSPGELLDSIYKTILKKRYIHNHIFILDEVLTVEDLVEVLSTKGKIKKIKGGVVLTSPGNKAKTVITHNVKEQVVEVFIESNTDEVLKDLVETINKTIKTYAERDYKLLA